MKKYLFLLLTIVAFLSACDSLSKLTQFDLPFNQSVTMPAMPVVAPTPLSIATPEINTNIDSVLNVYDVSADLVESVSLKKISFTLSSPTGGSLSFLKDVKIYLTASGADDVLIASVAEVGAVSSIDFTTENTNLKEYLLKDKFALKIVAANDEITLVEHKINIAMTFNFDFKVLGL